MTGHPPRRFLDRLILPTALLTALGTTAATTAQGVIYVNVAATGQNDGTTWANAYVSLQDALAAADADGFDREIWVAGGTYRPDQGAGIAAGDRNARFQLINDVAVYGGFDGWETRRSQRDLAANVTILSGDLNDDDGPAPVNRSDNSYHVVDGSYTAPTAVLDGFVVEGGYADISTPDLFLGGGLYVTYGSPQVANCRFRDCYARGGGGAASFLFGAPEFVDCEFSNNWNEPGILSGGGAVIAQVGSHASFTNCRFTGNESDYGGGVEVWHGSATLTNCTFANNHANITGGAVDCSYDPNDYPLSSDITLINCILWGDAADASGAEISQALGPNSAIFVSYSAVQGGQAGVSMADGMLDWDGDTAIDTNPQFADANGADDVAGTEDDDLRLLAESPCIDTGNTDVVTATTDLDGKARVADGGSGSAIVDMGAYEYDASCAVEGVPSEYLDIDWDGDGDVDSADYAAFTNCMAGPDQPVQPGCGQFDLDTDGDVDMTDFARVQTVCFACDRGLPQWSNHPIPPQSGVFSVEFDAVPGEADIDGLTGLSSGDCESFSESAVTPRFNVDGNIDARNGDRGYEAESVVPYAPGNTYHFRLVVNVPLQLYSVYVTPACGTETPIATNFEFRPEAGAVTELDRWHLWSGVGSHHVCNLRIVEAGNQPPIATAGVDQTINTPTVTAALDGDAYDDGLPAPPALTTLWSKVIGPGSVSFSNSSSVATDATFSAEGVYVLRLTADDGELSSFDDVEITVAPQAAVECHVSPTVLDLGTYSTIASFEVWSSGGASVSYSVSDDADWLSLSPTSGASAGEHDPILVTVNRSGLADGLYEGHVTVTPSVGSPLTVLVAIHVSQSTGDGLNPIARWDVVPYQRVAYQQTFKCGVVAFSKAGIQAVRFRVNNGAPVDVTSMTFNDRTGVYEYWVPILSSDFAQSGPISVAATVYGNDGGERVLSPLPLVVDADGTLPAPQAWVDATSGNDGTGQVNNSAKPFQTIGRAIYAIRNWMAAAGKGSRADGGIVRLKPGTHHMSNGGIFDLISTSSEWVTITTAAGGTRSNTIIYDHDTVMPKTKLLKCSGITVQSGGQWGYVFTAPSGFSSGHVWLDDCDIIGSGRHTNGSHPVQHTSVGTEWYTNSYVYDTDFGVGGGELARGLTMVHLGNDAFQHCPMIVNCTVDDDNPGSTGWHTDAWQWFSTSGPNNTIVYNYRYTNGHCQGLMCRTGDSSAPSARDVAFVNVYIQLSPPSYAANGPVSLWMRSVDHMLMWNCSFIAHPFNIYDDQDSGYFPTVLTNFDVRGCNFDTLKCSTPTGYVDFSSFAHNHFVVSSGAQVVTPGMDASTGSAVLDAYGRPAIGSPLIDRMSPPIVPTDAGGTARDALGDVGAYEYIQTK